MHEHDAVPGLTVTNDLQVCLETVIDDGGHGGKGRLTILRFRWTPDDALAVHLELSAQPDHPALPRGTWVLLRDAVRRGLTHDHGDGTVRLRPDDVRDRLWLELELPTYGRSACVSVARDRVAAFLELTEQAVPRGDERSAEAVDRLLSQLLDKNT